MEKKYRKPEISKQIIDTLKDEIKQLEYSKFLLQQKVNEMDRLKAERDTLMETLLDDNADLRYAVTDGGINPQKLPKRMYANHLRLFTKMTEEEIQLQLQSCNN